MQALASHAAEFIFRDIQPAAVFWCEAEVDATNILTGLFRWERFIKCAGSVRVQVVVTGPEPLRSC